jgi:hypothetical protein
MKLLFDENLSRRIVDNRSDVRRRGGRSDAMRLPLMTSRDWLRWTGLAFSP